MVSEYAEGDLGAYPPGPLGPLLVMAIFIAETAILIVPVGAYLGAFYASARHPGRPLVQVLLLVLVALLIVLFALVWIVPVEALLLYRQDCDNYTCFTTTPGWPGFIGGLIGAELGLVVLVVTSVTDPWRGER